ncbi:hypothetical protein VE01_01650 [Pseudogymnoascus verrucosus]|uniref:Zn(2)-C6 fungal-type domain-containing protein n=1 Tax=Pseudogymnoascus verrucosus TaxID=342668 RepID=A0A1B8GWM3_9PEZI|nr:uncharacterized protein VE01_01650 [Pseudogymnoascus verrucosus]OBU00228.2 hypothetical protein VE01_01650 [Pseudogymnoascus verrucosus]
MAEVDSLDGIADRAPARKKTTACRRCHSRKIKCSGGTPCDGCVSSRHEHCTYVSRNRKVKVAERYLQQVLAENERLKRNTATVRSTSPTTGITDVPHLRQDSSNPEENLSNPLMQDRAWFVPYDVANPPVYIGEAACTAFATRFRQALVEFQGSAPHIPRIHYAQDDNLFSALHSPVSWPSRAQAQLLLKVALININRSFHVVLTKPTLASLDQLYQDARPPGTLATCKFFALFALGEVYSSRAVIPSEGKFPGVSYFMHSCSLLPILPERATLEHIEILILLSFFSHNLNRRNSAYLWIGSALRLSLTLGLHHNFPRTIAMDPVARQHRVRIWWTIYICDRMWGSKSGHPLMIPDRDITVDLPSSSGLNDEERTAFPDPDHIIASIKLAKIAGNIITTVYCRGHPPPFIQSVQKVLGDLNAWMAALPDSIRLAETAGCTSRHVVSLHLSFNQCVILATRPVLLHVFTKSRDGSSPTNDMTPVTSTLADACLHTARHSNELLTQLWIEGALSTFGYFDAHYLFSSAVILAISSISGIDSKDKDRLDSAAQLLQSMADSGNLSATEFSGHLDQVRSAINGSRSDVSAPSTLETELGIRTYSTFNDTVNPLTAEMALLEQPMQDFITQAEFPFEFPNPVDLLHDTMLLFT